MMLIGYVYDRFQITFAVTLNMAQYTVRLRIIQNCYQNTVTTRKGMRPINAMVH